MFLVGLNGASGPSRTVSRLLHEAMAAARTESRSRRIPIKIKIIDLGPIVVGFYEGSRRPPEEISECLNTIRNADALVFATPRLDRSGSRSPPTRSISCWRAATAQAHRQPLDRRGGLCLPRGLSHGGRTVRFAMIGCPKRDQEKPLKSAPVDVLLTEDDTFYGQLSDPFIVSGGKDGRRLRYNGALRHNPRWRGALPAKRTLAFGIAINEQNYGTKGKVEPPSCCCSPSKPSRLGTPYRGGRSGNWLKIKNPAAPAVTREAEDNWRGGRPHDDCASANVRLHARHQRF
jgi:hypothetical protein